MKEESIDYLNENFERNKESQASLYLQLIKFPLFEFLKSNPYFQEIVVKHKKLYDENLKKYRDIDIWLREWYHTA